MFDQLTKRLSSTFSKLTGGGSLSESQVEEALKEIRRGLLEADVHYRVAKDLCEQVRQKSVGQRVWEKLSPGHQVVQLFHEELVASLGVEGGGSLSFAGLPPVVILVAGLQGSGKTTFCAKLALYLTKKERKTVGLIPADCARPAAKEQLKKLGDRVSVPVFDSELNRGAPQVCQAGLAWARAQFFDVVIVDTAGRQQIDQALMQELKEVESVLNPSHRFLVLDAMIGSQGLDVARTFNEQVRLTGLVMSKLDGDTRGGAALSARMVTGVPLVFAGVGEKPEDLELFHPDRMARRILGMGDVLTLVEKAREHISEADAAASASKMMDGSFTLEDFRDQLRQLQKLGPLEGVLKMLPGMGGALEKLQGAQPERELKRVEAIINSMTSQERADHGIMNGSRKIRVAKGSGTSVPEINRLLKQFIEMQRMMKQFKKMGMMKKLASLPQWGKKPTL
jgi:signal recognition particle subunit SRP54